jgi:hypothetical protein
VALAHKIRRIREQGLTEGASTRLLIYAAQLIRRGVPAREACRAAICRSLTDDKHLQETMNDLIDFLLSRFINMGNNEELPPSTPCHPVTYLFGGLSVHPF